ncbi:MAG: D-tyrosyl-tRNA(Tyr) deacylase [Saccharofermentans sp.]|nr:D-tyrosyl-tRNA(Tyr) deacylase [Saccharofermentans sp.]
MRFVIQNVTEGNVSIDGEVIGSVGRGFVVLIGIAQTDTEQIADKMIDKMFRLRVFEDENGKTNLNLEQVDGGLLLVSQFTLYADVKSGNRPGFSRACKPDRASELYDYIVEECRKRNDKVGTGEFGADMKVSLVNDGPFTIILDSDELSF